MARTNNNDSIWEFIDSFRQEAKQKIRDILVLVRNSKHHIKNFIQQSSLWIAQQLSGFKAKAARFIQWSAENLRASFTYAWQKLSYLFRNFPQVLNQALHWCANVLVRSFETGYRLTSAFLTFIAQELRNFPARVVQFAKECVHLLEQGFKAGKWLIKNTFSIVKEISVAVVKNVGRVCRYIFNNFGTLARQFFNGLYQALKELPQIVLDAARFLKNVSVELAQGLYRLGKEILMNLGPFLKELSLETIRAIRWGATTAVKKIWNGVGLTLGAIAAVFDLGVDLVKSVFDRRSPTHPGARHAHDLSRTDDREVIQMSPRTVIPLFRGRVESTRERFFQTDQVNVEEARHENRLRRA